MARGVERAVIGDPGDDVQLARLGDGEVRARARRVDREQQRPQRERAPQAPRARAITICWTSSVPSPIVRIFASR